MNPKSLPVYEIETALVTHLRGHNRLIVQAPTGSGKTTQVPQILLDRGLLGDGQVVILQPRRLATRLLAARVAAERGARLGDEVGYQIRFEDRSGPRTRIKYETEGILLRQMLSNPELKGVAAVIFDEFHERHLYGDITLARALDIQESVRPDLKILVMSATLAAEPLQRYLAPCPALNSEGRVFPVTIEYLAHPAEIADDRPWEIAAREFERLARAHEGDVLIFMPGGYEIGRTVQALQHSPAAHGCLVLPLHGELPPDAQDAAVARYDRRKVVVATNVAETSLTIDGIRLVIDSGLARVARFDPYRGINTLLIEKISRAAADQRAGRAGRTAAGHCLRLWTERDHAARPLQEIPEVRRLDLAEVVLMLKASGVSDARAFRWLEPPEPRALARAESLLCDLGAVDAASGAVTELGRRMLSFPVHPRYARMLLAAERFGAVRSAAWIAALTQGRNLLQRRSGREADADREDFLGAEAASDFFILMRALTYAEKHHFNVDKCRRLGIHAQAARQARPLFEFFIRIAREQGLRIEDAPAADEAVQQCVLAGFSDQLARRLDTGTLRCELVHGRKGELARESVVRDSPLLVAAEVREIEGGRARELNVLLSLATAVREEWLREMFPGDFSETQEVIYDAGQKRCFGVVSRRFRDLALESRRTERPPADAAAELLAFEVIKGNLTLNSWDHAVEQWILRVNFLARACPELGLPPVTAADRMAIIQQVCHGAVSYKEIKDQPVWPVLREWLNPAQQDLLDKHAPERIVIRADRKAKVTYTSDAAPFISARIQDLYDVKGDFRVAMGRVPLVIHILAPSQRPVQVTQDLAGFWRDHYPRIKQELQRKYPKHEWR